LTDSFYKWVETFFYIHKN